MYRRLFIQTHHTNGVRGSGTRCSRGLVPFRYYRVLLKIPNTSEQTVFAHDSNPIDVVMHAKRLGSKFRQFFAIEPVTSYL